MNITITGSLGNISKPLSTSLIAAGHQVSVISSNAQRTDEITAMGAKPLIGSVTDAAFLKHVLAGADAVYTMTPPNFMADDTRGYIMAIADAYAVAIQHHKISHVVNLSSIGADDPHGAGPAAANHYAENKLNNIPGTNTLHLRPGMFYTNFYGSIPVIKQQHMLGNNFAGDVPMALSHPADIARVAADALNNCSFAGNNVEYIVGDVRTGNEIAATLGEAIGETLQWMQLPDEVMLQALLQNGMSADAASTYIIEVGIALRNGMMLMGYDSDSRIGGTTLLGFAKEFAEVYQVV